MTLVKVKKKKVGRPKIHKGKHHTIVIRQVTYDLIHEYQKEQSKKVGIEIKMVDIVDIAVKAQVQHKNFFNFLIDFNKPKV